MKRTEYKKIPSLFVRFTNFTMVHGKATKLVVVQSRILLKFSEVVSTSKFSQFRSVTSCLELNMSSSYLKATEVNRKGYNICIIIVMRF